MKSVTKEVIKRPLVELLEELKAKVVLLESDRRAYYESSYIAMQQNRDRIGSLRKELYDLRKHLWDKTHSDLTIVSQAFQNRPVEKSAFSNQSARAAISEMDFRVSDSMKRFNIVRFATERKRQRVDSLVAEFRRCESEFHDAHKPSAGELNSAQHIRDMENRYDKLVLKCNECQFIQQTYKQIYERLYEEEARANSVLNEMEMDIRRCRAEKTDLIAIHSDAMSGRDTTVAELERLEEYVYADRKRREIELIRMRKVSEEHKLENERADKKVGDDQSGDKGSESFTTDAEPTLSFASSSSSAYNSFDDNYQRLKGITGISNVATMVHKFEDQLRTKHNLIALINTMEANINARREERADKHEKMEALKDRVDHGSKDALKLTQKKKEEVQEKGSQVEKMSSEFSHVSGFVSAAKFGLEHLMEKVVHIKLKDKSNLPSTTRPTTAEEYVLDLFQRLCMKIKQLLGDLKAHDVNDFLEKLMTEKVLLFTPQIELENSLKKQVPLNNARVLQDRYKDTNDEEESGDESSEWKSRQAMKLLSADFIEARTRAKSKNKGRKRKGEQKK